MSFLISTRTFTILPFEIFYVYLFFFVFIVPAIVMCTIWSSTSIFSSDTSLKDDWVFQRGEKMLDTESLI